jgi:hypothetical protein
MGNEYDDAIARLEAQKAEIDMAIAVLRKLAGSTTTGGGGPSGRGIHSGTFIGKTIPEAARMYLEMCHQIPQKPEQIAEALQRGGMQSKAANFVGMLQTILRRTETATGEFMRTPAGEWGLPEWFGKKAVPKATREKEEAAAKEQAAASAPTEKPKVERVELKGEAKAAG